MVGIIIWRMIKKNVAPDKIIMNLLLSNRVELVPYLPGDYIFGKLRLENTYYGCLNQ